MGLIEDGPLRRILRGQTDSCPGYEPIGIGPKAGQLEWRDIRDGGWFLISGNEVISTAKSKEEAEAFAAYHIDSTTPLGDFGDRYIHIARHEETLVKYAESNIPWIKRGGVIPQVVRK